MGKDDLRVFGLFGLAFGLVFGLNALVNVLWPQPIVSFEQSREYFYLHRLRGWNETNCDMGLCAPMRIIAAKEILLRAGLDSTNTEFKRRTADVLAQVDLYLLQNSNRADWQNFNQNPWDADEIIKAANAMPKNFKEKDLYALEQIMLATIEPS